MKVEVAARKCNRNKKCQISEIEPKCGIWNQPPQNFWNRIKMQNFWNQPKYQISEVTQKFWDWTRKSILVRYGRRSWKDCLRGPRLLTLLSSHENLECIFGQENRNLSDFPEFISIGLFLKEIIQNPPEREPIRFEILKFARKVDVGRQNSHQTVYVNDPNHPQRIAYHSQSFSTDEASNQPRKDMMLLRSLGNLFCVLIRSTEWETSQDRSHRAKTRAARRKEPWFEYPPPLCCFELLKMPFWDYNRSENARDGFYPYDSKKAYSMVMIHHNNTNWVVWTKSGHANSMNESRKTPKISQVCNISFKTKTDVLGWHEIGDSIRPRTCSNALLDFIMAYTAHIDRFTGGDFTNWCECVELELFLTVFWRFCEIWAGKKRFSSKAGHEVDFVVSPLLWPLVKLVRVLLLVKSAVFVGSSTRFSKLWLCRKS